MYFFPNSLYMYFKSALKNQNRTQCMYYANTLSKLCLYLFCGMDISCIFCNYAVKSTKTLSVEIYNSPRRPGVEKNRSSVYQYIYVSLAGCCLY